MGRIHKESRFIQCSKLKINFMVYSEYEETATAGEYRCIYTHCPIYSESNSPGYNEYRCNGTNRFGLPCPYAIADKSVIYRFPEDQPHV